MTVKQKYKAFKEQYEAARKQMNDTAQAAFKEFAADFFVQFPAVNTFSWVMYTPYFNDGDVCEFSVDYYSIKINGTNLDGDGEDIECSGTWKDKICGQYIDDAETEFCPRCGTSVPQSEELDEAEYKKAAKAASEMLQNFEDEVLKDMYGDHTEVTFHRSGKATLEEYEHD